MHFKASISSGYLNSKRQISRILNTVSYISLSMTTFLPQQHDIMIENPLKFKLLPNDTKIIDQTQRQTLKRIYVFM